MALRVLFSCDCANHIVFKGGTSLSKGWKLIERFSEDIDIAIDRAFFGFEGNLNRKQITNLRKASCSYVNNELKDELDNRLKENGIKGYSLIIPETKDSTKDPQIIEMYYESLFSSRDYVQNKVLIEVGARSLLEPFENIKLRSIIGDAFPESIFADSYIDIPTVIPQRTFLEKAFLLHEEYQKPIENLRFERMSRHLYDLEKIMYTNYAKEALSNRDLYDEIVSHRKMLTSISGIDYATHAPDKINFVPPTSVIEAWKKDYETMQTNMIYGSSLSFEELLERIKELNLRFRDVK